MQNVKLIVILSLMIQFKKKDNVMATVYHGTFWNPGDEDDPADAVFFEPSTCMSDLEACWFTNNQDVAKYFTEYNLDDDAKESGALRVILKGALMPLNALSVNADSSPWVELSEDIDEINVQDREELYSMMKVYGYNAFIIEDNYQEFTEPGSDIAVLVDNAFVCEGVALERKGGGFTPFMDPEKAAELFLRHAKKHKIAKSHDHGELSL